MGKNEVRKKWVEEVRKMFSKLGNKKIKVNYKKMSGDKLGYTRTKIKEKYDFDPEALILGEDRAKKRRLKPKKFDIFINSKVKVIENLDLRKEIVQYVLIHEFFHIEQEDLLTLAKDYNKRKKKKIHIKKFKNEVLEKYNQLREKKNLPKIKKRKHLEDAISQILEKINFFEKG